MGHSKAAIDSKCLHCQGGIREGQDSVFDPVTEETLCSDKCFYEHQEQEIEAETLHWEQERDLQAMQGGSH